MRLKVDCKTAADEMIGLGYTSPSPIAQKKEKYPTTFEFCCLKQDVHDSRVIMALEYIFVFLCKFHQATQTTSE